MTLYHVAQTYIVVSAAATLYLCSDSRRAYRRVGFAIGLFGQWAWFYSAYHDQAWGLALVNCMYLAAHVRGIITHRSPA